MKRLEIFIAVIILTAAILGLMKPKKKVQTPQKMMLDLITKISSIFNMVGR
ncbi:MAG: hypothetical protein ACE14P_08185 [Methanotrichaceae archaeon]